jgi:HAD superfamily hydrolase (TIGR01509 family)
MSDPFALIIFDCDGVLIDSEVISTHTLLEALRAHGLNVDIEYVRKTYLGRTISVVKEDYKRRLGRDLAETFESDFLSRLFTAYRRELSPMPGIKEVLAGLTVPFCMATSSSMERARLSLEVSGLQRFFDGRVFHGSMVARGKPAPDLFLHAAKTLGAEPARCLVIEDSEVGVLAARNAGMPVWRFVGGSHFKEGESPIEGDLTVPVFDTMEAVAAALHQD